MREPARGYRGAVRLRVVAVLGSLALISLVGVAAGSTRGDSLLDSPLLWATVDECKSSPAGDVVGLRGSMPGTGRDGEEMYMRFRLQYKGSDGLWRYLKGADSGFVDAGSSTYLSRQAGRDFDLASASSAGSVLRGAVIFDWRVGATTLHHTQLHTTKDREVGAGAVPPGYSVAHCTLS